MAWAYYHILGPGPRMKHYTGYKLTPKNRLPIQSPIHKNIGMGHKLAQTNVYSYE